VKSHRVSRSLPAGDGPPRRISAVTQAAFDQMPTCEPYLAVSQSPRGVELVHSTVLRPGKDILVKLYQAKERLPDSRRAAANSSLVGVCSPPQTANCGYLSAKANGMPSIPSDVTEESKTPKPETMMNQCGSIPYMSRDAESPSMSEPLLRNAFWPQIAKAKEETTECSLQHQPGSGLPSSRVVAGEWSSPRRKVMALASFTGGAK